MIRARLWVQSDRSMRRTARFLPLIALLSALAPLLGAAPQAARAQPLPLAVDVGTRALGPPVPPDFLGLSYEIRDIAQVGNFAQGGNLVGFLRSLGTGILRFGGATADTRSAWSADGTQPPWATAVVRPADLDAIAKLSALSRWRVLLTVNLGHFDPTAAQQETSYAALAMGSNLAGVEFGNEPDALARPDGLRALPWTFNEYRPQVDAYRAAISAVAPTVPYVGPDQASGRSGLGWLVDDAMLERPALLTAHYYPLAWCVGYLPTLADLLSPRMHAAEARMLPRIAAVARRHRIPLRIDETNDISCGGEPGVSNTFSSALWATDFLARTMTLGIAGINFHGHLGNPTGYSPLVAANDALLRAGTLQAQPEWYAMLLAKLLLGDRPLALSVRPGGLDVPTYAFASADGRLHLVVVNDRPPGSRPLLVRAHVGAAYRTGVALALTAPSLSSTTGVTLGGAAVQAHGGWGPAGRLPAVRVAHGVAQFAIAPASAVLVSLPSQLHR